jgi:glycine/serine hydroxymethyltransferase
MKEPEMREIGRLIAEVIHAPESEEVRSKVRQGVGDLAARFPLYEKRLRGQQTEREAIGAD